MPVKPQKPDDLKLALVDVARMTGRTVRWLQTLIADGTIARDGRGSLRLADLLAGLVKHSEAMVGKSRQTVSQARVQDARAQEIEMRLAVQQRDLIPADDAMMALSMICGAVNAELSGLPARVSRDMDVRRRVEAEVHDTQGRIAAALAKAGAVVATGGEPADALGADDA